MSRPRLILHGRFSTTSASAPVKTGNPIIIGSPVVGQTLTATHGTYTGSVTGYSGQWYSGASAISGATSLTYVIQSGDVGNNITYQESAFNGAGSSATGTSNALGPVTGSPAATYDTQWGTSTDANGWIGWTLYPGGGLVSGFAAAARQVWFGPGGNDANSGLSFANRKLTFDAAVGVYFGAGYSPGDWLMVGSGAVYTDNGTAQAFTKNGVNLTYPSLMISYDVNDPTNASKYGRLTGANMPSIKVHTANPAFSSVAGGDSGGNYFFVQGIEFDGDGLDKTSSVAGIWQGNTHTGIGYQNFRFKDISLNLNGSDSSAATWHLSKGVLYGAWASSGGATNLFINGANANSYFQDLVYIRGGWKRGVNRDDPESTGAPTDFCHAMYYTTHNNGAHFDRIVSVDASMDPFNVRGGATGSVWVSINDPLAVSIGGSSGTDAFAEEPLGCLTQVTDVVIAGGAVCNSALGPRANVHHAAQTQNGSFMKKVLVFDAPAAVKTTAMFGSSYDGGPAIEPYLLLDQWWTHNARDTTAQIDGAHPELIHLSWTNSATQQLQPGSGNTTEGTYPGAIDTDGLVSAHLTALGITPGATATIRYNQLVNIMAWRPDVQHALLLQGAAFAAYGKTPTYTIPSAPNLSAETPYAVY